MSTKSDALSELLQRRADWISGAELAAHFAVSARTIRNWTRGRIEIATGPRGYRYVPALLVPADEDSGVNTARVAPATLARDADIASPVDRARRVLLDLLDAPDGEDVYQLAERYFVSDLTLDTDLQRLRRTLANTDLRLERSREHIRIVGSERARRAPLRRTRDYQARTTYAVTARTLVHELRSHGYSVNELALDDVVAAILVATDRHERWPIEPPAESVDGDIVRHLRRTVFAACGGKLSDAELAELAALVRVVAVARPIDRPDATVHTAVREALHRVGTDYAMPLDNRELIDRLSRHVVRMRARARRDAPRNALTTEVKRAYPMLFDVAVRLAQEIAPSPELAHSADEQAYLALHLGAVLQPATRDRVRIAVNAPEYHDLADQLVARLAAHTDAEVTRMPVEAGPTGESGPRQAADLIVVVGGTEHVRSEAAPAIHVGLIPSDADLARVHAAVREVRGARARARVVATLLDALEPTLFVRGFPTGGAEAVIRNLAGRLVTVGAVASGYADGVLERERLSSTVFVDHVAVPHAMTLSATRTAIAIALDERPMDWNGEPVKLVVLVAFPDDHGAGFREFLDALVRVVADPANVTRLVRAAHTFDDFLAELTAIFAAAPGSVAR